jgi:hypothetical protein
MDGWMGERKRETRGGGRERALVLGNVPRWRSEGREESEMAGEVGPRPERTKETDRKAERRSGAEATKGGRRKIMDPYERGSVRWR